jgi:hypothetical protein
MYMYPADIFSGENGHIEELRISRGNANKLSLLVENFLPFFENIPFNPFIFNNFEFLILPKNNVIDLFGKIAN